MTTRLRVVRAEWELRRTRDMSPGRRGLRLKPANFLILPRQQLLHDGRRRAPQVLARELALAAKGLAVASERRVDHKADSGQGQE